MSTQPVVSGGAGAPINITGLASGLNTTEIINAIMGVERAPVTQMTNQQTKLQAEKTQLSTIQTSLQQLAFSAAELSSPSLFNTTQQVTSSDANQITAVSSTGAGVGGYQVSVSQLANSAQRTFTFTSPASNETLMIDGKEIAVKAGESAKELAASINSNSNATVYAAAVEANKIVLSDRTTGNTGEGFIAVSGGGTLVEQAGTAKQGRDAEYTVDGVAGTSSSNIVSNAIPGVTLTLAALTTTTGPVTIDVAAPAPSVSGITSQVESFVKLYNSTIGEIHNQLTTKPPEHPTSGELGIGTLFGDTELGSAIDTMRQAIYTPIEGLPAEMSSLANIGIGTGAAAGSASPSQGALEGELKVNTAELAKAIETNPQGVEKMLQSWGQSFQKSVDAFAEPGGSLETRISGESSRISALGEQITAMNEMLAVRQKTLQSEYLAMEAAVQANTTESSWLSGQLTALATNSVVAASTPTPTIG
jgi:flagellar hook-associated protein 2